MRERTSALTAWRNASSSKLIASKTPPLIPATFARASAHMRARRTPPPTTAAVFSRCSATETSAAFRLA
eukprot:6881623-Prymnesium_polylepis.1